MITVCDASVAISKEKKVKKSGFSCQDLFY